MPKFCLALLDMTKIIFLAHECKSFKNLHFFLPSFWNPRMINIKHLFKKKIPIFFPSFASYSFASTLDIFNSSLNAINCLYLWTMKRNSSPCFSKAVLHNMYDYWIWYIVYGFTLNVPAPSRYYWDTKIK